MQHYFSLDEVKRAKQNHVLPVENAFVTIGSFDGVHLGHQAILTPMIEEAHKANAPAAVVTFHPHPVAVLRGMDGPLYITSPEERAHLLGKLGIDVVITLTFDRALASLTAEEFMFALSDSLGIQQLWAGNDFALGRNRQGNIETLQRIGQRLGYNIHVISPVEVKGRISSSRIREQLRAGQMDEAAQLLGRPYSIEGIVVHGDGRGRSLGFPTANVEYWPGKIIPAFGVYVTWTWLEGRRLPSVTSVGIRPTFDNPPSTPRVEAFIIDFDKDIYDHVVEVEFLQFLRPELRFSSVDSLIDQMVQDTIDTKKVLNYAHQTPGLSP